MPWQQHVADVALEINPATGDLAYSEVNLTIPRQAGKTTLLLAVMALRCTRFGNGQRVVYTAQTRSAARHKWEDEHVAALDKSAFGRRKAYTVRRSNGSEAILWSNGSRWAIDAPTKTAGHGDTLDLGVIDEAFAHVDDRVEQAMAPAMITRTSRQLWVLSTAGDGQSRYLYAKVLAGRAGVDLPSNTAYFEWSAPEDAEPEDPAVWRQVVPALGHTITEDAIRVELARAKRAGELDLFRRAYLNQWVEVPIMNDEAPKVIPLEWFDDCVEARSRIKGPRVFAVDVTPDRATAAIVTVGPSNRDGRVHVETVEHRAGEGTGWVIDRLAGLVDKWETKFVAAHLGGPAGSLERALVDRFGDKFRPITDRELAQACGLIYDGIRDSELIHIGEPAIRAALDGAVKASTGDAWRWSRSNSSVDISTLVAATVGWFANTVAVADTKTFWFA